jgi:hypothetical protein
MRTLLLSAALLPLAACAPARATTPGNLPPCSADIRPWSAPSGHVFVLNDSAHALEHVTLYADGYTARLDNVGAGWHRDVTTTLRNRAGDTWQPVTMQLRHATIEVEAVCSSDYSRPRGIKP